MSQDEMFNSDDPVEMYEYLRASDPLFPQVVRQLQRTMIDEGIPSDKVNEISQNHETFLRAYRKIKGTFFAPVDEETVARSRHGGRDEWEALACAMGLDRLHDE
jgi:hypothetical protein